MNNEKRAKLPADWLVEVYGENEPQRRSYLERHIIGDLPKDVDEFRAFAVARRENIRPKIVEILRVK